MYTDVDYDYLIDPLHFPGLTIARILANVPKDLVDINKILGRDYSDVQKNFIIYINKGEKNELTQVYIPDIGERLNYNVSILPKDFV